MKEPLCCKTEGTNEVGSSEFKLEKLLKFYDTCQVFSHLGEERKFRTY